ncbi:SusC/RagA family TonB-linked outer membrane protein [uncultured Sanguibacteroides sp.]|uniref:SusC/RagA family TonB-linked outer membrane protein n=1 Tax=uncultured Sanguibacteroides sp. TaxID=1635151 RepID=UPI0025CCB92C|nr:SusC/RagA family TonB-linked outer membrane protein [uncultured Sanguibacteroides sp.]
MKKKRYSLSASVKNACWVFLLTFLWTNLLCFSAKSNPIEPQRVTLDLKDVSLSVLFQEIKKQTSYKFFYNDEQEKILGKISVSVTNETVEKVLDKVFAGTEYTYKISGEQVVVVSRKTEKADAGKEKKIRIQGKVTDEKKNPIPGVTVMLKGTTLGTATTKEGNYVLTLSYMEKFSLLFSFIGMETQEIKYTGKDTINVTMKEDKMELEDVIVTGYANVKKSSFTGSVTQVKKEDLMKVGTSNVVDLLQVFDPSLRVVKNNEMGSDPNTLPEFYVRGRSGISQVKELDKLQSGDISEFALSNNPNLPIFILDGFEVNVEKVYDLDLNRIKDITILKDAAATAIYGSRAANGVIVIETVAPSPGELRVSYSGNLDVTTPDLSSYNLMHAEEKLAAEWAAGLFKPRLQGLGAGSDEQELNALMGHYIEKRNRILRGIDNYWLSQPLTTELNHKHSIYVEGGTESIRFGIELRYDNQNGVMKKSYRDRVGAGLTVDYRYKGLQIRNQISYDVMKAKDSPYGSFRDYTSKQPYDLWADEETGEMLEQTTQWGNYGGSSKNPLYEAMLGNFSKNDYKEWTNNLSLNWYVNDYLLIKGQLAITTKEANTSAFTDPLSGTYGRDDLFKKGDLYLTETRTNTLNLNLFGAYNRMIGKHNINYSMGINIRTTDQTYSRSHYRGFPDAQRHQPAYAYEIVTKPNFTDNETRLLGGFVTFNYSYNSIYLLDASYRFDGSSEFGADRKWAPFWSAGAGINLHNYDFMERFGFITLFKIKGNVGETGKANFQPYMAKNVYEVLLDDWYPTGIGASPIAMGNKDLTWEKTLAWSIGAELGVWKDRILFNIDFYNKTTKDGITEVSLPSSSGFSTYMDNMGEIQNKGVDLTLNMHAFSSKDWDVNLFANLSHNKNKITKISDYLKQYNERVNDYYNEYNQDSYTGPWVLITQSNNKEYAKPLLKYEEGASLTAIYGMKSLGINPANGKEVYQKRDGTITYDWNPNEQQVIGDEEPDAHGAFGINVRFRRFTLYTTFLYEWGGDKYNQTLVDNVENVNLNDYNADRRVWTDRWQEIGDVTPLKSIQDRYYVTRATSRFVQKNNYVTFNSLSVGYDFNPTLIGKIGLSMLRLQFNMKDIKTFSTIKQEMGLSYPFARTFTFTLNASF